MKHIIVLLVSLVISSCSAQEDITGTMPDVITPDDKVSYTFEWKSNQVGAYMDMTIYPVDKSKPIVVSNITDRHYNVPLKRGDKFSVNIKHKESISTPKIYLTIYKTEDIFADEGLLYEEEIEASAIGIVATIDKDGKLK